MDLLSCYLDGITLFGGAQTWKIYLERETGLEPATACLEGRNSTTELLPRNHFHFIGE
jgi:hypothetical protein